jgi:hypothetical protein
VTHGDHRFRGMADRARVGDRRDPRGRVIVALAMRIAEQARTAEEAVEVVRRQTTELGGIAQINDSGVRILHAARALRKVAVGK